MRSLEEYSPSRQLLDFEIEYKVIAHHDHQPNLIAWRGNDDETPQLMIHSQIYTDFAGNLNRRRADPYGGMFQDNKITGHGAVDDKSSVACYVMKVSLLNRLLEPPDFSLCLRLAGYQILNH